MKVDRNQPVNGQIDKTAELNGATYFQYHKLTGMPLRLEIAARILSGMYAGKYWQETTFVDMRKMAFEEADAFIEFHNRTCEDSHEPR